MDERGLKITLGIALAIIICLAGYEGYDRYTRWLKDHDNKLTIDSAEKAKDLILARVSACYQVPLLYGNQTVTLVSVECLQKAQGGQ